MAKKIKYKPPYIVHTGFERDRQNIWVEDAKGRNVAEWWDEEINEMVVFGFFDFRRGIGSSVIQYLVDNGIIEKGRFVGQYGSREVFNLPDFSEE